MDRNSFYAQNRHLAKQSLSARRAWIEILTDDVSTGGKIMSLSARRAWIEIVSTVVATLATLGALRQESVDRNLKFSSASLCGLSSLSARRAWIEIRIVVRIYPR